MQSPHILSMMPSDIKFPVPECTHGALEGSDQSEHVGIIISSADCDQTDTTPTQLSFLVGDHHTVSMTNASEHHQPDMVSFRASQLKTSPQTTSDHDADSKELRESSSHHSVRLRKDRRSVVTVRLSVLWHILSLSMQVRLHWS